MSSLSLFTWIIHCSSVLEWILIIASVMKYSQKSSNSYYRLFAWFMYPALLSAFSACSLHFFNNRVDLDWFVNLQAFFTFLSNTLFYYVLKYRSFFYR
uniref:Ycf49 n=1 Tax=Glaucocystis incrassata TaxID=1789788 RepID=A0A3G1IVC2_9EUKA|nr:hypothetical protein Ycf49 [Glaucocystis incrassata]ASQ40004.1 hypothetical protein Ycf49 [Glaucocystis incrassata]